MDMNFGTGSQLLGDTSAIQAAAQSRGVDLSALQGVSSSAPTFQPVPSMPQGPVMPQGGQQMPQGAQGLPQGQSDSEIILNALSARLKSDSKIREAQAIPQVPKF